MEPASRSGYKAHSQTAPFPVVTHYSTLKVAPDAPVEVIRAAYRVLAARHHPDRCIGDPAALQRMQRVNEAYRVLSDSELRAEHDAALRRERRRRASDGAPGIASVASRAAGGPAMSDPPVSAVALRRRAVATYTAHAGLGVPGSR